ncbi:hypothetical protein XPA_005534 [Xanthoria parietina]
MVVFLRQWCIPYVLQVYSTIPLTENIIAMFHHDFNIGSFAQFGDPSGVALINNRTDFYNMSHLAIRQHLDAENLEDGFILLDETAASHAVWFVPTTEDSYFYTQSATSYGHPPVAYPGENFTLWRTHILTQDLPPAYNLFISGDIFFDDFLPGGDIRTRAHPYDPHDPQDEPFTEGRDYATEEGAEGFCGMAQINANSPEVMHTSDPHVTRHLPFHPPPGAVALTREAAWLAGLKSGYDGVEEWSSWGDRPPQPGDVVGLSANYDWDSPRWPPPGEAGEFPGPTGEIPRAKGIGRHPQIASSQQCVRRKLRRPGLASPSARISRRYMWCRGFIAANPTPRFDPGQGKDTDECRKEAERIFKIGERKMITTLGLVGPLLFGISDGYLDSVHSFLHELFQNSACSV